METWKKVVIGAVAAVLLIGGGVWGVSWWSHRGAIAVLDKSNPSPEEIKTIVSLLASEDGTVLTRAHAKIKQLGTGAVPALVAQTKVGEDTLRVSAAELLMEIDVDAGFDSLNAMLDTKPSNGPLVRQGAIRLVGKYNEHEKANELVVKASSDPDVNVQRLSTEAMPDTAKRSEAGISALKRLAESDDSRTSRHAKRRLNEKARRMRARR